MGSTDLSEEGVRLCKWGDGERHTSERTGRARTLGRLWPVRFVQRRELKGSIIQRMVLEKRLCQGRGRCQEAAVTVARPRWVWPG